MCGICGIVNRTGTRPPEIADIRRALAALSHRGPDGGGYYRDRAAALGHMRLSIIDLETGAQPLSNEDGTIWITFNGEIFNYVELSEELKLLGHTFRTRSDTEVIVHAWEEWGEDCFRRFNGQWALAIWETGPRRLVLSRDRLGIRPLYFSFFRDRLLFASEIKAILSYPGIPREFDPDGFAETFTFWGPSAPRTAFRDVSELEPGYFAVLQNGEFRKKPYWSVTFPAEGEEPKRTFEDAAEELKFRLTEAARIRFTRSDVPVGAYLSGGIDSSIITSVVARYTPSKLRTFSITFADSEFDESGYQDLMVRRLGTDHDAIRVTERDIGEVFPEVIYHAERPLLRTAPAPLFLLSRLVRNAGYKVVVTGEGSDEVLAGYDIFRELQARLFLRRNPDSALRKEILYSLYPWMERSPNRTPAFSQAFFGKQGDVRDPGFSHRLRWASGEALLRILSPEFLGSMSMPEPGAGLLSRLPEESSRWSSLSRAQWIEMNTLLSGYILSAQGDRMLMANSVEGRFPYLDVNVVEFAASLPQSFKIFRLQEKYLLRRAFRDVVPEAILNRPKQPYRAPDASSFFKDGSTPGWFERLFSPGYLDSTGMFRTAEVLKLVEKCRSLEGRKMSNTDNMRIVAAASTLLLHEQFMDNIPGRDLQTLDSIPMTVIDREDSRKVPDLHGHAH